jgi:tagatose 6-phosphate kinase
VIVTVTLNPALQVRYDADRLELGALNQVGRVRQEASGRGLAVARLLQTFGHEVVAAGLAGGSSGELIRAELARSGVPTQFTRINAESRRVLRIADAATGQITTLAEPAPYITTEELGRLATDFRGLLDGATAVVLCGSLPAGLPAETYGSLTSYAAHAGVPVILNAGGSALHEAASRGPALAIPDEIAPGDAIAAALMAAGARAVVLQGDRSVRAVSGDGEWQAAGRSARLPDEVALGLRELTESGHRDALVAGFVPGILLGWSWPDMLRHAVALAESVTPAGEADLAAYETLLPTVRVTGPRLSAGYRPSLRDKSDDITPAGSSSARTSRNS